MRMPLDWPLPPFLPFLSLMLGALGCIASPGKDRQIRQLVTKLTCVYPCC